MIIAGSDARAATARCRAQASCLPAVGGRCRPPLGCLLIWWLMSAWAGTIISSRQLADAYGITDTDGSRPDCWGYLAAYGWERDDGAGIDDFR